jgi:UDP-N-acetylmuramoyl-tripeptide--D-alanyl-D-alanine ligase
MMRLSQAAQATGARVSGCDVEFAAVSTDSRSLASGDLFVALRGDNFDGHRFVAQAAAAGAVAAMVDHEGVANRDSFGKDFPVVIVNDTLRALAALAQAWRRRFAIPFVALTGSNGKTTVKEMLAAILREAARAQSGVARPERCVLATRGNLNNHIGVPLTLLELRFGHRYAVIEMGMNHAGELSGLTRLASPDVALVNNAGTAHIEYLGTREAIARAKGEIFEGLQDDGVAVINADDPNAPLLRSLAGNRRQIDFGLQPGAAVSATCSLRQLDSEIVLKTPLGGAQAVVALPGLHNVRNALAAAAAATALDVPAAVVAAGLNRVTGVGGRLQRRMTGRGATLLDDTYNANPDSMRAAIDVLAGFPSPRVFVMGDMGELGASSAALHAEVGAYAANRNVDRLFALGEAANHAVAAFGAAGTHAASLDALVDAVGACDRPGTTLLVKGSRFMRMERVVAALLAPKDEGRETREEKQ